MGKKSSGSKIWMLARRDKFDTYSNRRLEEYARQKGVEFTMVAPEELDLVVTNEKQSSVLYNGRPLELPDCSISRIGSATATTNYAALAAIRHLGKLGVFICNSSHSVKTAADKLATLQVLAANSIPIPKTLLVRFPLNIELIEREFTYPLVVKPVSGSLGKGVFFGGNRSELEDIAQLWEYYMAPRENVLIQEFVSSSKGKKIRVIVIGGKPIGTMLRIAKPGKWKTNASGTVAPLNLNPELERLAIESAGLIGLQIAGVDILLDGDNYKVCEVNSSPNFEGFERATGIDVPQEIFNYVQAQLSSLQDGKQ